MQRATLLDLDGPHELDRTVGADQLAAQPIPALRRARIPVRQLTRAPAVARITRAADEPRVPLSVRTLPRRGQRQQVLPGATSATSGKRVEAPGIRDPVDPATVPASAGPALGLPVTLAAPRHPVRTPPTRPEHRSSAVDPLDDPRAHIAPNTHSVQAIGRSPTPRGVPRELRIVMTQNGWRSHDAPSRSRS
jgi:hypothetical protein